MGPVALFCGFYCAGILLVGIIFYLILIVMEVSKSPYLTEHQSAQNQNDTVSALGICIAVSALLAPHLA